MVRSEEKIMNNTQYIMGTLIIGLSLEMTHPMVQSEHVPEPEFSAQPCGTLSIQVSGMNTGYYLGSGFYPCVSGLN